jgi:hypothetical protein
MRFASGGDEKESAYFSIAPGGLIRLSLELCGAALRAPLP